MQSRRLDGKRVVLVGAGQTKGESLGFGRATALLFAREGARVMIVDRNPESAQETAELVRAEGGSAVVHVADHTSDVQCAELAAAVTETLGGVDVLYNGVGVNGGGKLADVTVELWDRVMDVNLKGMFLTTRHLVPLMIEQGTGGSIVLISSIGAIGGLRGVASAYGVSKAGLNRLTLALAAAYAEHNIRCNAILPGMIDTPMAVDEALGISGHLADGMTRAEYVAAREAAVPMAYKGSAMDVAYAALYFASDESRYVSGAWLPVDGAFATS